MLLTLNFCQILSICRDDSKGMTHYFQFGEKEVDEKDFFEIGATVSVLLPEVSYSHLA